MKRFKKIKENFVKKLQEKTRILSKGRRKLNVIYIRLTQKKTRFHQKIAGENVKFAKEERVRHQKLVAKAKI